VIASGIVGYQLRRLVISRLVFLHPKRCLAILTRTTLTNPHQIDIARKQDRRAVDNDLELYAAFVELVSKLEL
jgi:hypothetical protein